MKLRLKNLTLWERNLYVLFAAQLLSVVGFSLVFPFLPLYVEELGIATIGTVEFWAGMVFSAQAVTMGIMAPIWGALADRLGRKLMIKRALFGGAVCLALMGFARSAEELTFLRAIQGMITGVIPAASALVAASVPRERAGWALGLMQTSAWAGVALGPLLGGLLADTVGFHNTFKLTGTLLLLSGLSVHFWVTEETETIKAEAARQPTSLLAAWKKILTAQGMGGLYAVKFSVRLAATVILPIAPLLVAALMPESDRVATFAGLFTATTAAASTMSSIGFGSLGDRVGHRMVLLAGCLLSGVAYFFFLWVTNIWQLIALALVAGIANGAIVPNIGALLANASPKGGQGAVYGIDASVNAAARIFAPFIGTTIAMWLSLQAGFAVAGLIFLAAAVVTMVLVPASRANQLSEAVGAAD